MSGKSFFRGTLGAVFKGVVELFCGSASSPNELLASPDRSRSLRGLGLSTDRDARITFSPTGLRLDKE